MGYYTQYSLAVKDPVTLGQHINDDAIIAEFRATCECAHSAFDDAGSVSDSLKWYDYKEDITAFSKAHPAALFELSGEGEEASDLWKLYVLNGKSQLAKAVISFSPFSPADLA